MTDWRSSKINSWQYDQFATYIRLDEKADIKEVEKKIEKIFRAEEDLDKMQIEITSFLTQLLSTDVSHAITMEARTHLRVADEIESISDSLLSILKMHLRPVYFIVEIQAQQFVLGLNPLASLDGPASFGSHFIPTAIAVKAGISSQQ